MTWGRQAMNATASTDPADPNAPPRLVNVIATASSDQVCPLPSRHYTARSHTVPTVCQNMASTTMISFIYFLLLQSLCLSQRMIESFFHAWHRYIHYNIFFCVFFPRSRSRLL